MPLIKVQTSAKCSQDVKEEIAKELSAMTAKTIGKKEFYMTTVIEDSVVICMSGELGPGAFVEIRSIGGLNSEVNNKLAQGVCDCLNEKLSIPPERVSLNFFDIPRTDWAWNGSTFG